jgi:L-fuconolactonase
VRIDAHQHFWCLSRGGYDWLTPELKILYRDFLPPDLTLELKNNKIDGTILVQADSSIEETEYLLTLADQNSFIKGVVGWVDFEAASAVDDISKLAQNPKLLGLRPMIQDIPDPNWMLNKKLKPAFEAMIAHDLTFDALTLPIHLDNLYTLLSDLPELRVVIDHASKPDIKNSLFDSWAEKMTLLARNTNAYCKFSGLVTEAQKKWTIKDLQPYVDLLLKEFGSKRLIWGSDWPVCLLATDYTTWLETALKLVDTSNQEIEAIFGNNALQAYKCLT